MNNWKSLRLDVGLSQAMVSDKLGYSTPQFVSNWERGVSFPPLEVLPELARLYKVDKETLFQIYKHEVVKDLHETLDRRWKRTKR